MKPTRFPVSVPQRDLRSMSNFQRLSFDDRRQAAIQTGLERTGHQGIVDASFGQEADVNVEGSDIQESGDGIDHCGLGNEFHSQLQV